MEGDREKEEDKGRERRKERKEERRRRKTRREMVAGWGEGGEEEDTYCLCSIVGVCASFSMVVMRLEGKGDVSMCLRMGDGIREEGMLSAVWKRGRGKSVCTSVYEWCVCKCVGRETHIFLGVGGCA